MQYLGFFLVVVALVLVLVGFLNQRKAGKILAAPFKKTGEIAQNPQVADAKGTVSCEGAIVVQQPLTAPCSGKPCVYYEVELVRSWEKSVQTENGMKTEKGTVSISTNRAGSQIQINDGSGPVGADLRQDVECAEMEKSFEQMQNIAWGDVMFGQYRAHVPHDTSERRTVGVKAVEKIIPAQGNAFVMGKLVAGVITKADGMLGKLMVHTKGRDKLLGTTKRNAMIGFVLGGLSLAGGVPLSILGSPPKDSCANMKDAVGTVCSGHITNDDGNTYDWTVTKDGTYAVEALQPNVKVPIIPILTLRDHAGTNVVEPGESSVQGFFKAGKYKINVRDKMIGDAAKFKGGFSFTLKITGSAGGAPPAASAIASGGPAAASAPVIPASHPGDKAPPADKAPAKGAPAKPKKK